MGAFGPCIDLERNPHASFHWEAGHRGGGFYTGKRLDALEGSGDEGVELRGFVVSRPSESQLQSQDVVGAKPRFDVS